MSTLEPRVYVACLGCYNESRLRGVADFIDSLGPAVARKLDKYLTKRVEQERAMGGDE